MNKQTESYITLKPIAERFSRVANEMTDDDIKNLIKSELREQMKSIDVGRLLGYIVEEYFDKEETEDFVKDVIKESIKNRLK